MDSQKRMFLIKEMKLYFNNISFFCIDFGPGNAFSLKRRLKDTSIIKEKTIAIHDEYKSKYEKPTYQEGFKIILSCY
jgi:hypothetical protein